MLSTALFSLALALPALGAPEFRKRVCAGVSPKPIKNIQLGPRPFWLIDQLEDGPLKAKLESCTEMKMKPSAWSISHRGGGTLQFPEETHGSIMAGVSWIVPKEFGQH
jgi:glycerophosphoryl diester phosphodiesterase